MKRALDIIAAVIGLVILGLPAVVIALSIKLTSKGPCVLV